MSSLKKKNTDYTCTTRTMVCSFFLSLSLVVIIMAQVVTFSRVVRQQLVGAGIDDALIASIEAASATVIMELFVGNPGRLQAARHRAYSLAQQVVAQLHDSPLLQPYFVRIANFYHDDACVARLPESVGN